MRSSLQCGLVEPLFRSYLGPRGLHIEVQPWLPGILTSVFLNRGILLKADLKITDFNNIIISYQALLVVKGPGDYHIQYLHVQYCESSSCNFLSYFCTVPMPKKTKTTLFTYPPLITVLKDEGDYTNVIEKHPLTLNIYPYLKECGLTRYHW
jgi:hypothetical protein